MSCRRIAAVFACFVCTIGAAFPARADEAPTAPTTEGKSEEKQSDEKTDKKKTNPMNGYSVGLLFGAGWVGTGDVANPVYFSDSDQLTEAQREEYRTLSGGGCTPVDKRCRTPARRGFRLAIPIQIGGAGVSFRFDPFMTLGANAKAYGLYTGPNFDFHVIDPLYLGFGFGLEAAWVKADDWKYAGDLYGRIPVHAIYYVHKDVGLVAEFAFGAGASGYASELRDVINPVTGQRIARRSAVTFGFGRTWDLSFGVRFP